MVSCFVNDKTPEENITDYDSRNGTSRNMFTPGMCIRVPRPRATAV